MSGPLLSVLHCGLGVVILLLERPNVAAFLFGVQCTRLLSVSGEIPILLVPSASKRPMVAPLFQLGRCRSVKEFEKLNRIGEGTYGIVCEWLTLGHRASGGLQLVVGALLPWHCAGLDGTVSLYYRPELGWLGSLLCWCDSMCFTVCPGKEEGQHTSTVSTEGWNCQSDNV